MLQMIAFKILYLNSHKNGATFTDRTKTFDIIKGRKLKVWALSENCNYNYNFERRFNLNWNLSVYNDAQSIYLKEMRINT